MSDGDCFFLGELNAFDEPWGVFGERPGGGDPVAVFTGATVIARYSNNQGPAAGGHKCNFAIYRLFGNDIEIGIINLNNKSDGADKETIIEITPALAELVSDASAVPGQIDFRLECASDLISGDWGEGSFNGCHPDVVWVIINDNQGNELYNDAPAGFFVSANFLS